MRIVGVQFKIGKGDFTDQGFRSHIEGFYNRTNPGDIIVFPEDIGLLLAFKETKAETVSEAVANYYSENSESINAILGTYPDIALTTAIFLSLTYRFVSDFYDFFSSLSRKYNVYTVTCNNMARFEIRDKSVRPVSSSVLNTAFVFDRFGREIYRQDKVFLTQMEIDLGISSGPIEAVKTFEIEGKKMAIAISLDAFMPQYISKISDAEIVMQPDANPGRWNGYLENGRWQPEEWMDSSYYIAQRLPAVRYVINPMMVGNLLELRFEGESNIAKKAEKDDQKMAFIGNIPVTGFHSIIGAGGREPSGSVYRDEIAEKDLEFEEGVIELII